MTEPSAPAGWYPDRGRFRWWDGTRWVDRYLDEERTDESGNRNDVPSKTVGGLIICAELAVLGVAQLMWLGRGQEALGLAFISIGPALGVFLGTRLSMKRRNTQAKPHSLAWHVVVMGAMILAFLLFITAINGGVGQDAFVPAVLLTLVGTPAFVVTMKVFYPESFASTNLTEETS